MRIFIFSILFVCTTALGAQVQFQNTYSYQGDEAGNCLVTYGQNILAGGQSDDGNNQYAFLVSIGMLGDTNWTTHIGAPFSNAYGIAIGAGTKFAVACGGLINLDINGNLLWARQGDGEFRGIIRNGSGYYAAGNDSAGALFLWNTDFNGDTLWTKTYTNATHPVFKSMSANAAQQPYIAADSDSGIVLLNIQNNGTLLWNKTFRLPDALSLTAMHVNDVYCTPLGHILLAGSYQDSLYRLSGFLIHADGLGNVMYVKTYKDPFGNTNTFLNSVVEDYPNNTLSLFGTGEANFNGPHCMYLLKTDLNGDTIRTVGYRIGDDFGYAHALMPDRGFALVGTNTSQGNMFVARADSTGNSYCNMEHFSRSIFSDTVYVDSLIFTTGFSPVFIPVNPVQFFGCSPHVFCNSVGINEESDSQTVQLFPNPSNGNFTIERNDVSENATVFIYDMNGRELKQTQFVSGEKQIQISADLAAGVYLLRVFSANENSMTRIVLQPGSY